MASGGGNWRGDRQGAARRPENRPPRCGSGGVRAPRPTAARMVMTVPFGRAFAMVCRGGIYPSRGRLRRSGVPGPISGLRAGPAVRLASETRLRAQCEHRPLQRFVITRGHGFPGWLQGPSVGRRGGIYPSRGRLRRGKPGRYRIGPYRDCQNTGLAVSRLAPRPRRRS